jgi:hypothetical protein
VEVEAAAEGLGAGGVRTRVWEPSLDEEATAAAAAEEGGWGGLDDDEEALALG